MQKPATSESGLNPQQEKAAALFDGPLMILAGAGSGKTKTITQRILNLVKIHGVPPWSILALTFTNQAAKEMTERIQRSLNGDSSRGRVGLPDISTFHAFCAKFLRGEHQAAGLRRDFTIYDDSDQLSFLKKLLRQANLSEKIVPPKRVKWLINQIKNLGIEPHQAHQHQRELLDYIDLISQDGMKVILTAYENELLKNNAVDFAGLILKTYKVLRENPALRKQYQEKYQFIHVDEYQDTNRAQYMLLHELAKGEDSKGHQNLCVVGDEDQSIYRWRGADIRNILDFEKDFPEARIVKLEQNYRSTKNIIQAASTVIQNNEYRKEKTLWTDNHHGDTLKLHVFPDERAEAYEVIGAIEDLIEEEDVSPSEIAIFYRTNAQSRVFEDVLRDTELPYQIVGGIRFYERKEIKDLIAYLKVLVNPNDDVSLLRIINTPSRGIGQTSVTRLMEAARKEEKTLFQILESASQGRVASIKSAASKKLQSFYQTMTRLQKMVNDEIPSVLFRYVLEGSGYLDALENEQTIESESRIENLKELENAFIDYERTFGEKASIGHFLESITLRSDIDEHSFGEATISLMTVHASKGLEFPHVFIVGLEEGLFPSIRDYEFDDEKLEEERRLFYVALTRAKKQLYLSHAQHRRNYGKVELKRASRFLRELPGETLDTNELFRHGSNIQSSRSRRAATLNGYRGNVRRTSQGQNSGVDPRHEDFADEPVFDVNEDPTDPFQAYRRGQKIQHPTYGVGIIRTREGSGEASKILVQFQDQSLRKFLLKYASIELL
jgi:DNA helicase-2/ATP-dependent DNA helicase PcrA